MLATLAPYKVPNPAATGPRPVAEVHLLDTEHDDVEACYQLLDDTERQRIAALQRPHARRAAILGRGLTRKLVGEQLGRAPGSVKLVVGLHGRPFIAGVPRTTLDVNVSHTGTTVVVVISRGAPIGVDIEGMSTKTHGGLLAAIGTPGEQQLVFRRWAPARHQTLLQLWTRKEAVLKADGRGLTIDPRSVDVTRPELVRLPRSGTVWRTEDLELGRNLVAALASPARLDRPEIIRPDPDQEATACF